MMDLNDYRLRDKFNAEDYERNLEKNLKNARIAWTTVDGSLVNERVQQY
jgi:hypothetical protein